MCTFIQFRYSQEQLEAYNEILCMGLLEIRLLKKGSPDVEWKRIHSKNV